MTAINDLTGRRFGRLTVAARAPNSADGKAMWHCTCDCGGESTRSGPNLRRARVASCLACYPETVREARATHRENVAGVRTPVYRLWLKMRERCNNPNAHEYRWYGAKGIRVCPEWDDFPTFKEWAEGAGYAHNPLVPRGDRLSIDRIDPALGYSPSNCRFITGRENSLRARRAPPVQRNQRLHVAR